MLKRGAAIAGLILLSLTLLASRSSSADWTLHLALESSVPAADSTVAPPSEIRLRFSEAPGEGTTAIHLLDADGIDIPIGEAIALPDDPVVVVAEVTAPPLEAGEYAISWRAMAEDGHVATDEISFTVATME